LFYKIFIPTLIFLSLFGLIFATIYVLKFYHSRKKRRVPFTDRFYRAPGQSLFEKLDDLNIDLNAYLAMMINAPLILYAVYMTQLYYRKGPLPIITTLAFILVGCLITGYFVFKMVQCFNLRRKLRLGYEGEIATGQELNKMMRKRYHVYHDFVADKFNIDHIVVGPAGVFAVETKARAKPMTESPSEDAKVSYDGKCLHYPKWRENKPLEQAKRQATWLERWLTSATGEKTRVRPVVALPGWYVTRTSPDGILVINPKQFAGIAKPLGGKILNEGQISRIIHQIDQRCKNIEPKPVDGLGGRN